MVGKPTHGRAPGRSKPEIKPAPGAAARDQHSGKAFELRRIDSATTSMNAGLDRLLAEMPPEGERVPTNLAQIIAEDRE